MTRVEDLEKELNTTQREFYNIKNYNIPYTGFPTWLNILIPIGIFVACIGITCALNLDITASSCISLSTPMLYLLIIISTHSSKVSIKNAELSSRSSKINILRHNIIIAKREENYD